MQDVLSITSRELYIKKLLSVVQRSYTQNKPQEPVLIHRNEELLVCVLEGESIYEFGTRKLHLHPGDVVYLSRGCTYKRSILGNQYRTMLVYFYFDAEAEMLPPFWVFRSLENVELSFYKLYKKWSTRSISSQSECMSIFYQLYAQLIQSEVSSYLPKEKRELFEAVTRQISDNYTTEDISIASLAAQAQMSEVHFRRCFRKIYKMAPHEYIATLRITHAKELLQYGSGTVEEISRDSGFGDPAYFSRLFKAKTGYAPSEYREQFGMPS